MAMSLSNRTFRLPKVQLQRQVFFQRRGQFQVPEYSDKGWWRLRLGNPLLGLLRPQLLLASKRWRKHFQDLRFQG